MKNILVICSINVILYSAFFTTNSNAQRITTIQLEGTQYFISKMNPYAPELNYYLAYQYCRSIGLQLVSFESMEKTKAMSNYLKNAGYTTTDYWTAGNKLGTNMLIWMSTGLPFNSTFSMMRTTGNQKQERSFSTRAGGRSVDSGPGVSCVALTKPLMEWDVFDCMATKDFICEQTRCYYYNYGAIPVTTSQGISTTRNPIKEDLNNTTVRPTQNPYTTTLFTSNNNLVASTEIDQINDSTTEQDTNNSQEHPVYVAEQQQANEYRTQGPYDYNDSDYPADEPVPSNDNHQDVKSASRFREPKHDEYYSTIVPDNVNIF